MALPIKELIIGFVNTKKTALINVISNRPDKEKQLIVIVFLAAFLAIDYFLLVKPCIDYLYKNTPEIASLKSRLDEMRQDQKNKALIEKNWKDTALELETREKMFISPNEIPALIENLSKTASDSRVKILSLQPVEAARKEDKKDSKDEHLPIPIKIDGLAGAHELGSFLARLESGETFIRITDMRINSNPQDSHRHLIGLDIEAYKKAGTS